MVRHLILAGLHTRILLSLPAVVDRAPVCNIRVACHTHGNVWYDKHTVLYVLRSACNVMYCMTYSVPSQQPQGSHPDLPRYRNLGCPSLTYSGVLHSLRICRLAAAHVNHSRMTFDPCFNVTDVETVAAPHCLGNDDRFGIEDV